MGPRPPEAAGWAPPMLPAVSGKEVRRVEASSMWLGWVRTQEAGVGERTSAGL